MAPVCFVGEYFGKGRKEKDCYRPSSSLVRGKFDCRCRVKISAGPGLESKLETGSEIISELRNTRCRPHGNRSIKEMSNVLLMDSRRHRGLGHRFSGKRCILEPVESSLLFPSFSPPAPGVTEGKGAEGGQNVISGPMVAHKALLSNTTQHADRGTQVQVNRLPDHRHVIQFAPTRCEETPPGRMSDFWKSRDEWSNISSTSRKLIGSSWRPSTEGRYRQQWKHWLEWSGRNSVSTTSPSINQVLDFLGYLFDSGLAYRTINVARSAISVTLQPMNGYNVGEHPLVCRLMKGIFNERPPQTSLVPNWSVSKVLGTLREWSPAHSLDLRCLTMKTCMLVALASGKRCSSLSLLSLEPGYCEIGEQIIRFQPCGLEKHSRPGFTGVPIKLEAYNQVICIYTYILYM